MKEKRFFSLSRLQVRPYDPTSKVANEYPACHLFDDRHDFVMLKHQSGLAILMTFANECFFSLSECVAGVNAKVSVSVVDRDEMRVVGVAKADVIMTANDMSCMCRADIPFAYENANAAHQYLVTVRDEISGTILGHKEFSLYDLPEIKMLPTKWYEAKQGCVVRCRPTKCVPFLSIDTKDGTYYAARFEVDSKLSNKVNTLPELEMRIYFPDGEIESSYCTPRNDEYGRKSLYVELPFIAMRSRRGVCYAELRIMGYAFTGFVFSTAGPEIRGVWTCNNKELDCVSDYAFEKGVMRFERLIVNRFPLVQEDNDISIECNIDRISDEFLAPDNGVEQNLTADD